MFSLEHYRALTSGAAWVRRRDRGLLQVTGSERRSWLQGLLTNDVETLPVHTAAEAAYLTPQGRMVSDLRLVHEAERTLVDVPASLAASLQQRLGALIFAEDVEVTDCSAAAEVVEMHGPQTVRLARSTAVDGLTWVPSASYGVPGVCAYTSSSRREVLTASLLAGGVPEVSLQTLDVLRVESGRPAFLVDMDEHTIPLEAGLEDRLISFSKGCYVGQEVIVRIVHRGGGRVVRRLVGLQLSDGGETPVPCDVNLGGRAVGRLTSAVWSPVLGRPIGLATLHRDAAVAGTTVTVGNGGQHGPAQVTSLPFVNRSVT